MPAGRLGRRAGSLPFIFIANDDEAWYVLEGSLCVRVGNDVVEAKAGSAVFVPRGTPHTYWNPGPGLVRYLLVMTSNIYSLIQDIHAMTDRSPAALRAVFEKHDSERIEDREGGRAALDGQPRAAVPT